MTLTNLRSWEMGFSAKQSAFPGNSRGAGAENCVREEFMAADSEGDSQLEIGHVFVSRYRRLFQAPD